MTYLLLWVKHCVLGGALRALDRWIVSGVRRRMAAHLAGMLDLANPVDALRARLARLAKAVPDPERALAVLEELARRNVLQGRGRLFVVDPEFGNPYLGAAWFPEGWGGEIGFWLGPGETPRMMSMTRGDYLLDDAGDGVVVRHVDGLLMRRWDFKFVGKD